MKKLAIILVLGVVSLYSIAQDDYNDDQIQTIFSKQRSNGAYGALTLGYTQIDGQDAFISGGRGAFIFDHSLAIGIAGYGFMNNLDHYDYYHRNTNNYTHVGGYGGIFIEPIVSGKKPVHLSFPILVGIGGIALTEDSGWNSWEYFDPGYELDHDLFFVFEPAVELEFNMVRFFRTALYASYRFTSDIDLYETDEDVLRGLNFGITFKFGKF